MCEPVTPRHNMESREKGTKKFPKLEEMSKDEIKKVIVKKRETTVRAQAIVENLLEPGIKEALFLNYLPFINQSHLEDVVIERAIASICGYPPCTNTLSKENIPKQQYRISIKSNKVYDITARKNFCSNKCYKATSYVMRQMLSSPLWFREYEEIPNFHLMPDNTVASMGKELDISFVKIVPPDIMSINTTMDKDSITRNNNELVEKSGNITDNNSTISVDNKTEVKVVREIAKQTEDIKKHENNKSSACIGQVIEKHEKKVDPTIESVKENKCLKKNKLCKQQNSKDLITNVIIHVEKCIAEWFTLDSIIYLFGENRVKEMMVDKGEYLKNYFNSVTNSVFYSASSYDHYQQLCRKLNMLELEDYKYHSKVINKETKPLPDYSTLTEESKRFELKVKSYLAGELDVPQSTSDVQCNDESQNNSNDLTQLPLIDTNCQNSLRRKILSTNLNKVISDLQRSLNLQGICLLSDLRLLINTFKLKATNIMFKPIHWNLIGIVMIKLLSIKDTRIQQILESEKSKNNLQLLMLSYKQDIGYLDRLLVWLTDIDRLLNTNNIQFTDNM